MHLILILDENLIAGVSGDRGVPSESNGYIIGPTIHPTAGGICSSCVGQDKHSTPATQQQNNGRSGGSSDDADNTGSIKGTIVTIHGLFITQACVPMKYLANTCYKFL